jgi:uncharacterized protein (DUF885 family)
LTQKTSFDRRDVIKGGGAAVIVASGAAPGAAFAKPSFSQTLANFADEVLRLSPETATSLGIATGKRSALKYKLADISSASDARWFAQLASMKKRLAAFDRKALTPAERLQADTVMVSVDRGLEAKAFKLDRPTSGFFGNSQPYPVSQQNGAISGIPEFLDAQHAIVDRSDADAYVARVTSLAAMLDQETARIHTNAGHGITPPIFVAKTVLSQLKAYRAVKPGDQKLVTSLVTRAAKLNLPGDWQKRILAIVDEQVYPALDRQIAAFEKATLTAGDIAGVHHHPDGEAYYAWGLKLGTTTNLTPSEIHKIGIEQNAEIMAQMDVLLKSVGMTKGSVGERVLALTQDPKQSFPDTNEGRAAAIAYCNAMVEKQRALMPKLSHMRMKAPLVIKRVPEDIQDGASLGYMNFGSLDGSRPAIYYLNLKSTTLWPKYQLATLTAHEGVPGHTWQGAYLAANAATLPLLSSMFTFNAFQEGWALYSEQLVDEFGLYADDPLSRIGYLQAQQFRACRLVVDTGLHAMRWSREKAIAYLVENTGKGQNAMTSEVDRYCVSPGQACGYKVGHNEMLRLRARAKAVQEDKFDLAGFNDSIVSTGGVPLNVLSDFIDTYLGTTKS